MPLTWLRHSSNYLHRLSVKINNERVIERYSAHQVADGPAGREVLIDCSEKEVDKGDGGGEEKRRAGGGVHEVPGEFEEEAEEREVPAQGGDGAERKEWVG